METVQLKQPSDLAKIMSILEMSGLVAIPTETVYGLAANAFDESAVAKIFAAKGRPHFDPLIVHVSSSVNNLVQLEKQKIISLEKINPRLRPLIELLISTFWPGPLTLILPKHPALPDLVTSGLDTVAVRMPKHEVLQKLLLAVPFPLAAPSANRFGRISPTSAQDVAKELGDRVDLIIDGGRCQIGIESTIIAFATQGDELYVLRQGGTSLESLRKVTGMKVTPLVLDDELQSTSSPLAPGMLKEHYAPLTPLYYFNLDEFNANPDHFFCFLIAQGNQQQNKGKIALITLQEDVELSKELGEKLKPHSLDSFCLSPHNLDVEAARNLFKTLRHCDESGYHFIIALNNLEHTSKSKGLWPAIDDRLTRAAKKW